MEKWNDGRRKKNTENRRQNKVRRQLKPEDRGQRCRDKTIDK